MSEFDDLASELHQLRASSARAGKRALFRWCFRWIITGLFIAWLFPKYPVLWWSLILLVPLGVASLIAAMMLFRTVPARCDELEHKIDAASNSSGSR
jgi:hypothetical protein